jgi:hypothetical protein
LSRFVPGAVWQYLSRIQLTGRWGVPPAACLAATFLEMILLVLAAIPVALWNLNDFLPRAGSYYLVALAVFLAASAAVIHPVILNRWVSLLARLTRQPHRELRIHWSLLAGAWLSYLGVWVLLGLSLSFFVRGLMTVPFEPFPRLASDYAAAWVAGIFAMIAPAGVGVREGALGLLLRRVLPVGAAFTLAVAIRLWLTLVELVWAALSHGGNRAAPPDCVISRGESTL